MAVAFTQVGLGPFKFGLPDAWTWRRPFPDGPVQALHIQIEPEVTLDVQVIPGLGDAEGVRQLVEMHARAGDRGPSPPALQLPAGTSTSLAVRLAPDPPTIERELHALTVGSDLVVAILSWVPAGRWGARDVPRLRRWVELLLRAAVAVTFPLAAAAGGRR